MNNAFKVRPFDWRDTLLVQRLQTQGLVLNHERAHVDGVFPLRDALRAYLLLGTGGRRTLVMSGQVAFAQYVRGKESKRVRLTYLAPAPTNDDYAGRWVNLLNQLTAIVGAQKTHHIVAEASHDGPEVELLQRIGFGVFTRQMLFRRASSAVNNDDLPPLPGLRPWQSKDDWGVRLLYANTVPQLVQQIEAPIDDVLNASRWPHRLVLEQGGEIVACVATRRGRVGNAMRLLLHPKADACVEALIRHGLATLASSNAGAIYCRVRRYESWLQTPLETSGFESVARTVLLVKHTVARVMTPEWQRLPAVEGRAEATTPFAHARLGDSAKVNGE